MRKQVIVVGASLAMFAAVYVVARLAAAPNMALLYSGLENGQAGDVVAALEAQGVQYDIRGGAIFVPEAQRDGLRMTLASEGLPANSTTGYELLDTLTGFGTTSQMFDAAYWRAKEGELARTILASTNVRSVRVHIANATSNPFQRDLKPSASVFVTTASGDLSASQARAFKFLVSSAVAGLDPNDVSIIDGQNGLVFAGDSAIPATAGADRSKMLREQVMRLLDARLGSGNAVVEVVVETVNESATIRERRVDPESRVAISTDSEERTNSASDAAGGDVTVASNLPDGDAAEGSSNSQNSETRERVNYEVSETESEILRAAGDVRRLSVAVLVNENAGGDGQEPLSDEDIDALQELVASAVGFDEARGDTLTIKAMPFTPIGTAGTEALAAVSTGMKFDVMSLVPIGIASAVALILGLFVVRPILMKSPEPAALLDTSQGVAPIANATEPASATKALTGELDDGSGSFAPIVSADEVALPAEDPVERLRALISERQDETVEVLRGWLDQKSENV